MGKVGKNRTGIIVALSCATAGLGVVLRNMPTVVRSASEGYKGSTRIGHALSKHANRKPTIWGNLAGDKSTWHDQAMRHLQEKMEKDRHNP